MVVGRIVNKYIVVVQIAGVKRANYSREGAAEKGGGVSYLALQHARTFSFPVSTGSWYILLPNLVLYAVRYTK